MSPRYHTVPLTESQHNVINPTNAGSALDDGVEDRLHVGGRAADDAEHLGRCRLMLQRLAQFRVALAEFLEQSHILDGDDGLVGEGLEKRDLIVGEGSNLQTANPNHPDWDAFAEQRHETRSITPLTGAPRSRENPPRPRVERHGCGSYLGRP